MVRLLLTSLHRRERRFKNEDFLTEARIMRNKRLHSVVTWFEDLARSFSEILQTPEPVRVPVRIDEASERDFIERRKLLARSWPRLPPLG
jgi:hypothetical protein